MGRKRWIVLGFSKLSCKMMGVAQNAEWCNMV